MLRTPWRAKKRSHSSLVGPSWQPTLGLPRAVVVVVVGLGGAVSSAGAASPPASRPLRENGVAMPATLPRLRRRRNHVYLGYQLTASMYAAPDQVAPVVNCTPSSAS